MLKTNTFTKIYDSLLTLDGVSLTDALVYGKLEQLAIKKGYAVVSRKALGFMVGKKSTRTIARSIAVLRGIGLIECESLASVNSHLPLKYFVNPISRVG